jgi:uncharacterized protein (DUF736 family)
VAGTSRDTGAPYVSLILAAPEFRLRRLYANLWRATGQGDDECLPGELNSAD